MGADVGEHQQSCWRAVCVRRWSNLVFAVMASLVFPCSLAKASPENGFQSFEVFSGVDVSSNSIFGYFGGVWVPGGDVNRPGLRVKALAGKGRYSYSTIFPGFTQTSTVRGDVDLFQLLAGYQWSRAEWTIKTYFGAATEDHDLQPRDPANSVSGSQTGAIAQVELWRNLGMSAFFSIDGSYSTAFDSYFAQGRIGKKVSKNLSIGLEGAALGNKEYESGRGGGFMRFQMGGVDLTLSGGIAGDYYGGDIGGYGALGLYGRF